MKKEYFLTAQFFLIVAAIFYLFYRLMIPFFMPIAWAAVLVIVFYPGYKFLVRKIKSPVLASVISCILIFLIIIGPSVYVLASLASEAADALTKVNEMYQSGELTQILTVKLPFWNTIRDKLSAYPQLAEIDFETIIKDATSVVTRAIGSQATTVIANISKTLFYFVLMLFAMFFFFRDGDKIVRFLKRITPLAPEQVAVMYSHMQKIIEGMMYGGVLIALIQGALGGILFAVFGISSPVFWGAIMAFLAFIPVLGPFLVYIPAGAILFFGGSPVKGIALIAIGTVVVSQIDNFLRPQLFSGKTQMHTLMLFFSIMGGLYMFGLIGVVMGPLIAAVFISLLRVFEVRLNPPDENTDELAVE